MYRSSIPSFERLPFLVKKVFSKKGDLGLGFTQLGDLAMPPLLNSMKMSFCSTVSKLSSADVNNITNGQGCHQQGHDHMATCRKGFMGLTGCRLCMPAGFCEGTHPVYLRPLNENEKETHTKDALGNNIEDYIVEDPVPTNIFPLKHQLLNPSIPTKQDGIVVWETDRPRLDSTLPSHEDLFGEFLKDNNPLQSEVGLEARKKLYNLLQPRLCGFGAFDKLSPFWKWIEETDVFCLSFFYELLCKEVEESNGDIATFNPLLNLCTGSHNNASLLGSLQQAKGAVFYLCPYLGKTKFPLQQALMILNEVVKHVEKFPSKAENTGCDKRTTQHIMQRTLNKMMLLMELTDFQIAADLLDLPCIIRSEQYSYLDANASMALQSLVHFKEQSGNIFDALLRTLNEEIVHKEFLPTKYCSEETSNFLMETTFDEDVEDFKVENLTSEETPGDFIIDEEMKYPKFGGNSSTLIDCLEESDSEDIGFPQFNKDDLTKEIGRLHVFSYKVDKGTDEQEEVQKEIVPVAAFYSNRGKLLKDLNRYEYTALIKIVKKKDVKIRERTIQFPFGDGFTPACQFAQQLEAKHRTVVITSKSPPHPGSKPNKKQKMELYQWQQEADVFARYILTIFRPEITCFQANHQNCLGYTWDDFQKWINLLQQDNFIISKFRLMAVHLRVQGFNTSSESKVILGKSRGRNRTIWSPEEQKLIREANARGLDKTMIDEYEFRLNNAYIQPHILRQMKFQCLFDFGQKTILEELHVSEVPPDHITSLASSFLFFNGALDQVFLLAAQIKNGPTQCEIELLLEMRTKNLSFLSQNQILLSNFDTIPAILNEEQNEIVKLYFDYFRGVKPPPHLFSCMVLQVQVKALFYKLLSN